MDTAYQKLCSIWDQYKYKIMVLSLCVFELGVSLSTVIPCAAIMVIIFCGIYLLNMYYIWSAGINKEEWMKTESGQYSWGNSKFPPLFSFHLCCLGAIYLGWDVSLYNFMNQSLLETIVQFLTVLLVNDFGFYIVHYVVHKVPALRKGHNRHHQCDLRVNQGLCTLDEDYVEAFVRDYLPVIVGTLLLPRYNAWAYCLYYMFYTCWSYYVHSSYNRYHLKHHDESTCNYGIYYIADIVFRTYQ